MPVDIEVLLQLDEAEKELNRFQDEFVTQVREAAAKGEDAFKLMAEHSDEELRKLALAAKKESERIAEATKTAAKEASRAMEKSAKEQAAAIEKMQKEIKEAYQEIASFGESVANETRGFLGDLGDAVDILGGRFFGLSEAQKEVVSQTFAMAEKTASLGGTIGSLAGPLGMMVGTGVGAVVGGLLGRYAGNTELAGDKLIELNKISIETGKIQRQLALDIARTREQLGGMDTKDLPGAISKYDAVGNAIKKANEELDTLNIENKNLQKTLATNALAGKKNSADEVAAVQRNLDAIQARQDQIRELERTQDQTSKAVLALSEKETKKSLEDFKLKADLSREELKANKEKAKAKFEEAQNAAALLKLQTGQGERDPKQIAKDVQENAAAVAKAKSEYQSAADAYDAFGKAALTSAKNAAKAAEQHKDITRDELDAIIEAEREKAERIGGVKGGQENALQQKYDAEAEAQDRAFERFAESNAAWILEEQRKADAIVKISQDEQERVSQIFLEQGVRMRQEQLAKDAQEIEQYAATVNNALSGIGSIASSAIGGIATNAFNNWLEALATGEKDAEKSFAKMRAAAVRNIGQQLVADGVKNILQGSANLITGNPAGGALIGIGSAEVAAGVGMGASGARAQRRQGYGDDKKDTGSGSSLGRNSGSRSSGPVVQAPTIIQIQSLTPGDKRAWQEAGHAIERARTEYHKG